MAIRQARLITKNSNIEGRALPTGSNIKLGEAVVNLSEGVLYYSGDSATSGSFTPSDRDASYFEVGSNLYDLNLRNRIIGYEGVTNVAGKFLSGTTSGFTLADISSIAGVDTYVDGFTYNSATNTFTISQNEGQADIDLFVNQFSGLTIGDLNVTGTITGIDHNDDLEGLQGGAAGEYYHVNKDTYDALSGSASPSSSNVFATMADIAASSGDTQEVKVSSNDTTAGYLEDKISGSTYIDTTIINEGGNEVIEVALDKAALDTDYDSRFVNTTGDTMTGDLTVEGAFSAITVSADTFYGDGSNLTGLVVADVNVSGGSVNYVGTEGTLTLRRENGTDVVITGFTDDYTTAANLIGNDLYFDTVGGASAYTVDLSGLVVSDTDTTITAFTYDNANQFTISDSTGGTFTALINTVTGMTNTGNLDIQGEIGNSTGNVVINDDLNISGDTTAWGDILPGSHLTYKLGDVGSRWDELYVRKVRLGVSTTTLEDDSSNMTMSGNNGNFIFMPAVDMEVHADMLPDADLTRKLGDVGQRWSSLNVGDIISTGMTLSNLTAGRVVYVGAGGTLVDEAGFTYNEGSDTLTAGNLDATNDLTVAGDAVIQGALTVFGPSISAFTSELYIEDNNIFLNYNPTGDTSSSSIGAGFTIQDGDGSNGDVVLEIRPMNAFSGITAGEVPDITEYTGANGVENRAFVTQLNDLVIRSTDNVNPDGVRVLAEFDCIDGGTY